MEKFLIVGLGNIGPDYEGTRHNIGFSIVEALADSVAPKTEKKGTAPAPPSLTGGVGRGSVWEDRRYGFITRISVKGRQLILLKPSTFMNLSGNAVRYWMQQEKIELEHLLICVDDLSLPFGQLRMKPGGSDAGHNGLKHIAQVLGTQQFARLRFGIGNDFYPGQQVDYVLSQFPPEQQALIPERTKETTAAIKTFCLAGIQMAMNQLNKRRPAPNPPIREGRGSHLQEMSNNTSSRQPLPSLTGGGGGGSAGSARLDRFLWAARIYKTRTMAAAACKKGQVSIGGAQMKPSRTVKAGDVIDVRKPPVTYSFRVLQAIEHRVGAKLIPEILENVTSPEQYEILEMNRISGFVGRARGTGRPTKKERRALDDFSALAADEAPLFISDFPFDLDDE